MKYILLALLLMFTNCEKKEKIAFIDECPIIIFYPCNTFSKNEAFNISEELTKFFKKEFNVNLQTIVENNVNLPRSLMNKKGTRYEATKVIKYFTCNSDIIQVILLNDDIFKYKEDKNEWGILGQSIIGGNTCVASSYRLKNKNNMWKLVLHEYCHTKFKFYHCLNDDPKCFMKDAKGKANLEIQKYLCKECKKVINFN